MKGCGRILLWVFLLLMIVGLLGLLFQYTNQDNTQTEVIDSKPIHCDEVLPFVTNNLERSCRSYPDGNSACYGNTLLAARFQDPNFDLTRFDEQGELTELEVLSSLETAPYNPDTHEWGIAVLRLRAMLEGTTVGEVVTMVLYGDTNIEADMASTPEYTDGLATLSHYPAFYFSTRAGTARDCNMLPDGGILIDTPDGTKVAFTANGVEIVLGSTILLHANPTRMTITVLDGEAEVKINNTSRTVQASQQLEIVMTSGGRTPSRFVQRAAVRADLTTLGLSALCPIAAALDLTFPCAVLIPSPTPTTTVTPTPSTTPTRRPSSTPRPTSTPDQPSSLRQDTGCALVPRLGINSFGQVTPGDPNRLRAEPDTSSATIGSIPGGSVFYVLDGPVCADEILYWLVDYDGSVGWTGEGSNGVYWAEPYFEESEPANQNPEPEPVTDEPTSEAVTAFAAAYELDLPAQGSVGFRVAVAPNTNATFYATTASNVCSVQWVVWVGGVDQAPVIRYDFPFSFTHNFSTSQNVDVWAYPYRCETFDPVPDENEGFFFAVAPG